MKFLKILNVINPLIYYFKYQFKHKFPADPYTQAKKFLETLPSTQNIAKKVLIVPYRVADSNLFEGNCALILKSRGYEVDALMCGQAVSHCEQIDFTKNKNLRCNLCFYEQKKFIESFGVHEIFISHIVSSKEMKEVDKEVLLVDLNLLADLTYRDVPIYRPLSSALQLFFKNATFCIKKDEQVIRGYLKTIFITIRALDNYFKANNVEFVLLSHGVYSSWGTVQEYCLKRSIKFVTWGRVYHGAGVIAAHNASYLNEPMFEKDSVWNHKALTAKQRDQVIDYLEAKVGVSSKTYDYVSYYNKSHRIMPENEVREQLGLEDKKIVGLFPNIPWDGQTFRPNLIFKGLNEWVFETINWFSKRNDCILIIRSHPAEKYFKRKIGMSMMDVLKQQYGDTPLPSNVIVIPSESNISSLSIASISCAALLYGSTIGYETTFLKVPTILASQFYYSDKEISFDPKTVEDYFSLIAQAINGELRVDQHRFERLLQYSYHYQFRRVMPETLMDLKGVTFQGYKDKKPTTFIADKVINKFIDKCLSQEHFYFDDCYE